MDLQKSGHGAGRAVRAYARDLASGFARQIDRKTNRVVAGGAVLALTLGLGAGVVGRAPLDRALAPHPMAARAGTAELPASLAAPPPPVAPARVAMQEAPPPLVSADDPAPTQADGDGAQSPDETQPDDLDRYGSASSDRPPWADRAPRVWAPPPPPPDYDPD
jgi:hypothetical protein